MVEEVMRSSGFRLILLNSTFLIFLYEQKIFKSIMSTIPMQNNTKMTIMSLFVLFLLLPNSVEGDADTLDRTKIGVAEGEIYMARVEKYDRFEDDSDGYPVPKPGDIFVTFEILEIDTLRGTVKLNLTFTEDYFGEDPELTEIIDHPLEDIGDGLFVYTDWEYWKMNLTKSIEMNEFENRGTIEIIDNSNEFGFKSTYEDENDWSFDETTTDVETSEYVFDKSTGAIKRVKDSTTYTFENGTVITDTTEFKIAKNFNEDSLALPGFEFYFSFLVLGLIVFARKKLHNQS